MADRLRGQLVLFLLVILPLAAWTPFHDCFPLAKWLVVVTIAALMVAVAGVAPRPGFRWAWAWAAWLAFLATTRGPLWRSAPEAALLVAPVAAASFAAHPRLLARALVLTALGMAAYALAQAAGWDEHGWLSPFQKGVASTIGNPDLLGGFLILPTVIVLAGVFARPGWTTVLPFLLLGAALLATEARAAWLGLAVAGTLLVTLHRRHALPVAAAVMVVVAGLLAASPGLRARTMSGGAFTERLWTWRLAARAVREAPVTGYGPGSFRSVYLARQTATRDAGETFFHYTEYAHLEPLHLWVETGVVGLGVFLWGLVCVAHGWWNGRLRRADPVLWQGIGAGAAGVVVNAGLSFPFHVPPTAAAFWILLGAAGMGAPRRASGGMPGRMIRGVAVAAILLVVPFRLAVQNTALRTGQVLALAGRPDLAGIEYALGTRAMNADPRLGWYAATAARERGDAAGALRNIDDAIRLEPGMYELHHERGMTLKALGRPAEAEAAYRQAVRINPGFASGWNNLGNLLGAARRFAEAEAAQRRALALDPGSREARQNLAITLMQEGRGREARDLLKSALAPDRRGL
jgi:O-antigen ligase